MKNALTILTVMIMATTNYSVAQEVSNTKEASAEREQIKNLIKVTFLNGALNAMNIDDVAKGVHQDFNILTTDGTDLIKISFTQWMEVLRAYKNSPEKMQSGIRNIDHSIELIDVTGSSAVAKLELYRKSELIGTDYISLLKFSDGWKAVSKVSHNHIHNPLNL